MIIANLMPSDNYFATLIRMNEALRAGKASGNA